MYRVAAGKIEVIPHGTPDCAFVEPDEAKAALGFGGRPVILTFGLLSPSKGIEVMIDAMPEILRTSAAAVYVVLGATHPNLIRDQGEAYRDGLMARVRALGIEDHVVFLDQFVDQAMLLRFISMCDVYATPYLNEAQMTSGTLAYSFGLGKAVVSTPYWHARELLGEGRGILVPFGDAAALGRETAALLSDERRRLAMRERAYADGRAMIWPRIAGLLQHAVHSVPDRSHGYCTDDNARALLLGCALGTAGESPLPEALTSRFAAFLQHAWNPETRRFRNFMGFDRRWLAEPGSEDSHGRALWALGECAQSDRDRSRRARWAASLFAEALPAVEGFRSPRAWSFILLGLDAYCATVAQDADARRLRGLLANRLIAILTRVETQEWPWFEEGLAYDNARLPQALIMTGSATGTPPLPQCRFTIPALAHEPADNTGRALQARRLQQLRRAADAPAGLRPAAPGSHRIDLRMPRRLASRRKCHLASLRRAGVRMVLRQQRSVFVANRPGNRQLLRWTASGSRQREPGCGIRVRNPLSPTSSASPRCVSSAAKAACTRNIRRSSLPAPDVLA